MKILAIRIKNLASLEGTTEIDFMQEPLCSAGIFAITGPTGAGKSTILDALCLALYAKTPRYAQARETGIEITDVQGSTINQSDVRAILRDGTAEGYAEVDFVGVDDLHYRANWSVRRARNRIEGSLQQANTTLKNLTTGNDIGGHKKGLLEEITRLLGLNYEQFIRSVLLAQGDFTAFLKADKDQKASLLEKLTGTHIYSELSKKIFERHREEEQRLKLLQQRQEGIAILTTEELVDLNERQASLAKALEQTEVLVDATTKEINWHEERIVHQAQVAEAQQVLDQHVVEKTQSAGRETHLKQVEQVQPTRTWMDALHEVTEHLTQRKKALEDTQTQQQLLAHQAVEIEAVVKEAAQHLEARTADQEVAKPLLDEAKRLDAQLQAKEAEVAAAQQQLDTRKAKWTDSTQRLVEKRKEADTLDQQIQSLRQWKEKHVNRQPIAEHHTLIVTKLSDARKQLDAINRALSDTVQYEAQVQTETTQHVQLVRGSENLVQQVGEAKVQIENLRKHLSAIPVVELRQESKTVAMQLDELLLATTQWRIVYQGQLDTQQLQQKLEVNRQKLDETERQHQSALTVLQAIAEQRKVSANMLEKAMIAASANVEILRGQLAEGQACPVCGSESHPYAHQNPQLNHVLNELKTAHNAIEQTYGECFAKHSQLSQAMPLLQQTIQELESGLSAKQTEFDQHTSNWGRYAISEVCIDIDPAEKEAWLRNRAHGFMADQIKINERLDDHQKTQESLDHFLQMFDRLQTEYTRSIDATKDLARTIQSTKERLARVKDEQISNSTSLEEKLDSLQPYFPDLHWINNWKEEPETFLQRIANFATEWNDATNKLEKATQQFDVLQATLGGIKKEQQNLATDLTQAEHDLTDKQTAHQRLRENRQSIFNGEVAEIIESRLKQQIIEAQEQLNGQKQRQELLRTDKTQLDATAKETIREITRLEKRLGELSGKIEQWLSDYNAKQQSALDSTTLQKLLDHPTDWISEEREVFSVMERTLTQATSVLNERNLQLTQHENKRPSDQNVDDLMQQLAQQHLTRSEFQQDLNEIGFRLKQDENNKRQLGDLLAIIQAHAVVVENWSKLNDIIGSADGKKFRQVAQEYTLDVLLSYANIHLEVLSKRYSLQRIPNTLGLQVLDQDMGDEVRTVYSLSGGESFLVSLALALGLASLSTTRMQVESLFIDEGFGSLDPNTLNIAMDALERLHNQGRKVGVISHVQEMTERIPVQIKVSKQRSGKSEVEVIGV